MVRAIDGFMLNVFEFMGADSPAQRYISVTRLKQLFPQVPVVLHDDACHLRRFADHRQDMSSCFVSCAFPSMVYILDRFHVSGHIDLWCYFLCMRNVHPDLDFNRAFVQGRNTFVCELTFSCLARYKHMFRKMRQWIANFFLQELVDMRNVSQFTRQSSVPSFSSSFSSSFGVPLSGDD